MLAITQISSLKKPTQTQEEHTYSRQKGPSQPADLHLESSCCETTALTTTIAVPLNVIMCFLYILTP